MDASKIATGAVDDSKLAPAISATKLGTGLVDNTEFAFLDGVTSGIQGQFGTLTTNLGNLTTTVNGGTGALAPTR
ncbi:MAG: hypothetical protein HS117_06480 [Verrucomicrobiaceae bacterium]|nr:hypothetical protein [Verrucomicrobiaceae bacterium]